jgi:hypothetical protein
MLVLFDTTPGANQRKPRVIASSAGRKDFSAYTNHFMHSGVCRIVRNSVQPRRVDFISRPISFRLLDDNVHTLFFEGRVPNVSLLTTLDNGSKVGGGLESLD